MPNQTESGTKWRADFAYGMVFLAFVALDLSDSLNPQLDAGTKTSAEAPLLHSAAEILLPLASAAVLALFFFGAALTYYHLTVMVGPHVAAAPISRRLIFMLCVSVGTLNFIVFGKAPGGDAEDHSAQARALGLAALRALPAAATGTFFSGMTLIILAHVHAGGEGVGGAVAGDGPIQRLLRLLTKVAAGAAAALVGLMVMALSLYGAKY